MDVIFLDYCRCNLILKDEKEVERQIVITFFVYLLSSSLYFFVSTSSLRNGNTEQPLTQLVVRALQLT